MEQTELFEVRRIVHNALEEDIQSGDVTTDSIIPVAATAKAEIYAKESGVIAGIEVADIVFRTLDNEVDFNPKKNDGDLVNSGDLIATVEGKYRALLTGERTALNFLQRMSGIATQTSEYCRILKGSKTKLLDTRKTVPGLRRLDKYAVKCGGGTNHRTGLFDMVMIKDNHIKVAGGIIPAIKAVKEKHGDMYRIEVECTNLEEVNQALEGTADVIMLDNMTDEMMTEAVRIIDNRAVSEASGNITATRLQQIAQTGVNYISSGALTHSVKALDISMKIK